MISFDDFQKVEIRIAKVLNVEQHPNADRLYVITVDLGEEGKRTVVAGIKAYYQPEDLIGKQIAMITNLEPREIRGIKSQGMLLAADDGTNVSVLSPTKEVKNGCRVR